ncbi:AP-5 complex subunit zeta-1 [Sphaerodactylus townsendi]|uniref:AP-5 complex subunit zeta-1 n=1 Tax=Sphaerodactylus townsendi TaxID=933632 RepID=UPI0020268E76|nr:AP-5 complex subunit zeta-1 [Sphaerodactylus townsendi]XP_048351220.1 AP-5 complex subunit zeta-1 [Sphaerodactylus townsendi]XP_048351221.1 AP-5 complex subunit zeta-1 [Sphaerodactylus townsendi]XP_048351222.1 AP-5 complex subunit zeta-1 [Sphaerodactylus townsendi]XP_048351223.1 AP-5 complex subunit zeta-1 [Sphaerodactylus townsendi]XP_048351224.1 AP-5 complex subunit zeta-1 [Sphaerodactylus townsendi]
MYTAGTESFLHQARKIQDEELKKFTSRITGLFQNQDFGNETIDCLQRLLLIVSATKYGRKLDGTFVDLLQRVLQLPKSSKEVQVLCSAILREMLPSDDLSLSWDKIQDMELLSLTFPIILTQRSAKTETEAMGQRLVRVLEGRLPEGQSARHLLPLLSKVISLVPTSLNEDQINLLSKRMVDWLRYASVQQGTPQSSGGFFNPRARQPGPITEVDGTVATDFFTVLSIGQHYTDDQWFNMQAFSMLRKWLLCYGSGGTSGTNSDDKSEVDGSIMSMVSVTSTSSRLLPPKERLREKAFEYCQRLLEQSNRRALKKADRELQKACLIEAVTIMDIICKQDSSYVYRSLSCLKILHDRISGDLSYARVLLPIAQFFLNHSETAAIDSEAVYKHLFTKVPAQLFHSPMLAYEFIQFCRHNVSFFTENLCVFRQSTPNLFKFLAWNSPALISEFMDLLPALLGADTAMEIFHLLLDLPCLTAALDIQLKCAQAPMSERAALDAAVKPATCLEAFRHPQYRGLFQYLLRAESAPGDPSRVTPLRQLLGSMASSPRVVQCAESVPVLLQLFFGVVAEFADGVLANKLVLALLERSSQLYEIPVFKAEMHQVMGAQLPVLCKRHPSLVVELSSPLMEFSGTVTNIQTKEGIFTHVVWAIGEYASVKHDRRCTVEQINKFFEALEAMLFEITQLRPSASLPQHSPRVITVLMTALAKLASRSQDLIPRTSLFLSKMRLFVQSPTVSSVYSAEDTEAILTRATELMNLLKMPSVAQFVLTPSDEVCSPRFHRDTHVSLPLAMKTTSQLLEGGTGSVPA